MNGSVDNSIPVKLLANSAMYFAESGAVFVSHERSPLL